MPPLSADHSPYSHYEDWKGWSSRFAYGPQDADYYTRECAGIKIVGAELLEIGFGSGCFLAWARDQGARVCGTEVIPALVAAAASLEVEILPIEFEKVAAHHRSRFDTITAFDVFEHFSLPEVIERLRAAELMLKPGGQLLLRFPNAQSPFGLAPQFGDPTHKTALSLGVIEPLIQGSSLTVARYGGAARAPGVGIAARLVRRIRYFAQDLIAMTLNSIYARSIPWDPVVVLVLRKRQSVGSGDG